MLVVPAESRWMIQRGAADVTSTSLQKADLTSRSLREADLTSGFSERHRGALPLPSIFPIDQNSIGRIQSANNTWKTLSES